MTKRKNSLGRGLGALLQDSDNSRNSKEDYDKSGDNDLLKLIDLELIETNPYQPRTEFDEQLLQELAESIKIHGIIQPITVRKIDGKNYQLISGERRFQASKLAGLNEIPSFIRTANDQQMLEMALIENIQRENLNAIEVALSYQRLITEVKLKQEELGERVGKNRATITNYLRLLKLPPDIQIAVRDNKISMGHARALISVENADLQLSLLDKILREDLSVRKVEELVRTSPGKPLQQQNKKTSPNTEIQKLESRLTSHFGTKINLSSKGGDKGEIRIPYVSTEDLNRILEILDIN